MNTILTEPIATYFQAANAHNSALLPNCFSENAVVQDEGLEYHGLEAIMKWNEEISQKYALTLKVLSTTSEDGQVVVEAQASGNFEGSPAIIHHYFTVENNKITFLRCG